jgi:hypothetical protein
MVLKISKIGLVGYGVRLMYYQILVNNCPFAETLTIALVRIYFLFEQSFQKLGFGGYGIA